MNKVSVTRKDVIINMNTEIRLAAELVYQTELRFSFMDRALFDKYTEGCLHERLSLEQIVDLMGRLSFCNSLVYLYSAGMSFASILDADDRAIRLKIAHMKEEEAAEEDEA